MTDNIKLPPMPEWAKMDNLDCMSPSEIRTALNEFGREAVRLNAQAVPDGWRLVPVDETDEMVKVGDQKTWVFPSRECWAAMLSAAPAAPQPAQPAQPLIADEICDAWEFITGHQIAFGPSSEGRTMYLSADEVIEFARAIERAHGIGGKND